MRKRDELTDPNSCMSKAREEEMTFVLLGRDVAAPLAIKLWVVVRVLFRKNRWNDPKMIEAWNCARTMEAERLASVAEPAAVLSGGK